VLGSSASIGQRLRKNTPPPGTQCGAIRGGHAATSDKTSYIPDDRLVQDAERVAAIVPEARAPYSVGPRDGAGVSPPTMWRRARDTWAARFACGGSRYQCPSRADPPHRPLAFDAAGPVRQRNQ
jgi:hypothetical protein